MPFTPFHFGPGLALKGLMPRHVSLSMFALANVAMDVEPLYRMWRIEFPLHGVSHTLAGAVVIAAATAVLGKPLLTHAWQQLERWHLLDDETPFQLRWTQAWFSALLGTLTHLLLDALMHADMQPFAPFTTANPLLHTEWMMPLHLSLACLLMGMFGMLCILARAAFAREHA